MLILSVVNPFTNMLAFRFLLSSLNQFLHSSKKSAVLLESSAKIHHKNKLCYISIQLANLFSKISAKRVASMVFALNNTFNNTYCKYLVDMGAVV